MSTSHMAPALQHPELSDPNVLDRIGERLRRELGAEHVIVYGSVAKGEATRDSDIDLLVIASVEGTPYERMASAHEAVRDLGIGLTISPLVVTPEEIRHRLRRDDRFIRQILESGVEVGQAAEWSARRRWGGVRPMAGVRASDMWREHARQDWDGVNVQLAAGRGYGAGVFLQQAIEKFLKGWLLDRGWQLQKTHDLKALLHDASAHDPSLVNFQPLCNRVSNYYWVDRYPGAGGTSPTAKQVETDRDDAKGLILVLFPDEQL